MSDRLAAQLAFLAEADWLRPVMRATTLAHGSQREARVGARVERGDLARRNRARAWFERA